MKLRLIAACIAATAILLLLACTSDTATTSATEEPTATEEASATRSPTPSPFAAEIAYLESVRKWADDVDNLNRSIFEIASRYPPLPVDDSIALSIRASHAIELRDEAYEFDAPAKYASTQTWVERTADALEDGAFLIYTGVEDEDETKFFAGFEKMDLSNEYVPYTLDSLDQNRLAPDER